MYFSTEPAMNGDTVTKYETSSNKISPDTINVCNQQLLLFVFIDFINHLVFVCATNGLSKNETNFSKMDMCEWIGINIGENKIGSNRSSKIFVCVKILYYCLFSIYLTMCVVIHFCILLDICKIGNTC